jgi:hypothetical protein
MVLVTAEVLFSWQRIANLGVTHLDHVRLLICGSGCTSEARLNTYDAD